MAGLGIYHYGARFYSPKLGRFLSADTIVPGAANPQAYNRYSYANNSPIMYIDPTGHTSACVGANVDPDCNGGVDKWVIPAGPAYWRVNTQLRFGITLSDDGGKAWNEVNAKLAYDSLVNINNSLNSNIKSVVGGGTWTLREHTSVEGSQYYAETSGTNIVFETIGAAAIYQMNIYHEFGHVLDNSPGLVDVFSIAVGDNFVDDDGYLDTAAFINKRVNDPNHGTAQAVQHRYSIFTNLKEGRQEHWADIFANYVAGNINTSSPFGPGMEMYNFVHDVLTVQLGP